MRCPYPSTLAAAARGNSRGTMLDPTSMTCRSLLALTARSCSLWSLSRHFSSPDFNAACCARSNPKLMMWTTHTAQSRSLVTEEVVVQAFLAGCLMLLAISTGGPRTGPDALNARQQLSLCLGHSLNLVLIFVQVPHKVRHICMRHACLLHDAEVAILLRCDVPSTRPSAPVLGLALICIHGQCQLVLAGGRTPASNPLPLRNGRGTHKKYPSSYTVSMLCTADPLSRSSSCGGPSFQHCNSLDM